MPLPFCTRCSPTQTLSHAPPPSAPFLVLISLLFLEPSLQSAARPNTWHRHTTTCTNNNIATAPTPPPSPIHRASQGHPPQSRKPTPKFCISIIEPGHITRAGISALHPPIVTPGSPRGRASLRGRALTKTNFKETRGQIIPNHNVPPHRPPFLHPLLPALLNPTHGLPTFDTPPPQHQQ